MIAPQFLPESSLLNRWLNQLLRYAISTRIQDSRAIKSLGSPQGTNLEFTLPSTGTSSGTSTIARYQISTVPVGAYITAVKYVGSNPSGSAVPILVPDQVANGPGFGSVANRPSINSASINYQPSGSPRTFSLAMILQPGYLVGDFIYVAEGVDTAQQTQSAEAITRVDLNVEARHWRLDILESEVCVNNVTHFIALQRSGVI